MTKKIRLIDNDTDLTKSEGNDNIDTNTSNSDDVKKLMKLAEAIDWKLWEMLKLMQKFDNDKK